MDDESQQDPGGEPDEDAEVAGSGAGFRGWSIHAANFHVVPEGLEGSPDFFDEVGIHGVDGGEIVIFR